MTANRCHLSTASFLVWKKKVPSVGRNTATLHMDNDRSLRYAPDAYDQ